MASEAKPTNLIHRRVWERRNAVQDMLLAGSPTGIPADQVGIAYAGLIGRYRELVELEEFVRDTLASGDDSD